MDGIVVNRPVVEKLQNILNDSSYRDAVENSASFNTRLSLEKRLRLPFLDAQTGVAQNHCHLWMQPRHRMPGHSPDQVYTYPSKRWRKKRRSYLITYTQSPKKKELPPPEVDVEVPAPVEVPNPLVLATNEDSKHSDSNPPTTSNKDEASKDGWYYEDQLMEHDDFEEPDVDSDFDYEENKKKKKKALAKSTPKTPSTRGRKKQIPMNYDATDTEKPYSCETCGARYKTRPGLTYHYTHSHKNLLEGGGDDEDSGPATPTAGSNSGSGMASAPSTPLNPMHGQGMMSSNADTPAGWKLV